MHERSSIAGPGSTTNARQKNRLLPKRENIHVPEGKEPLLQRAAGLLQRQSRLLQRQSRLLQKQDWGLR
jgi:hypothetical protein